MVHTLAAAIGLSALLGTVCVYFDEEGKYYEVDRLGCSERLALYTLQQAEG
jgi:hypothetical protein